jgi:sugar (pentulose or hexulose) kinase
MHTLEQNYHNVLISKLQNIPSGSAELYKAIIQPFCHSQYVELSQIRQCMSIEMDMCTVTGAGYVHSNWRRICAQ